MAQQVQKLVDMGFPQADATRALQQTNSNLEQAVVLLLGVAGGGEPEPTPPIRLATDPPTPTITHDMGPPSVPEPPLPTVMPLQDAEDPELSAVLEMSMRARDGAGTLLDGMEGPRKEGLSPGLLNIGNTCYVNSLLQTLLHIDEFSERMLRYRTPEEIAAVADGPGADTTLATADVTVTLEPEEEEESNRREADISSRRVHCIRLASELQRLFARSLFTARGCMDPSRLLSELVDQRGQKVSIGSQEDVGEFMLKLLEQLDEGLRAGDFVKLEPLASDATGESSATPSVARCGSSNVAPNDSPMADTAIAEAAAADRADEVPATAGGTAGDVDGSEEIGVATEISAAPPDSGSFEDQGQEGHGDVAGDAVVEATDAQGAGMGTTTLAKAAVAESAGEEEATAGKELPVSAEDSEKVAAIEGEDAVKGVGEAGTTGSRNVEDPGAPLKAAHGIPPWQTAADDSTEKKPSLLHSLFFGEQTQILTYGKSSTSDASAPDEEGGVGGEQESKGSLVVSEERIEFGPIFLEVDCGDLYKAWEAANRTEVDYTTPSGEATTARKSIWIERLPKVLFFQLQRVGFDQEKKAQVKLDDPFQFDWTVHADRFLRANQTVASQVASRVRRLQGQRDELLATIRNFEEYQGRPGLKIEEVLGWAADCLEDNAGAKQTEVVGKPSKQSHPHHIVTAEASSSSSLQAELQASVPSAAKLLRVVRDACSSEASRLRREMETLDEQIGSAYESLEQHPFELYAIWVHQGIAGSGHYFAYLRDWQKDRWIRFDDTLVSVVAPEEVREASVGQEGSNSSAYFLVYVERRIADAQRARDCEAALQEADSALPRQLMRDIRQDNESMEVERSQREERLAEQELRRHAEAIFQDYAGRLHQWDPLKFKGDSKGDPHDPNARKFLQDPALLKFELFLYRLYGEQEVWTYLVSQSIEAQRSVRQWAMEDDGRVLHFFRGRLLNQKRYASMLRDRFDGTKHTLQCELVPLDTAKLLSQYNDVLVQAHIVDEALQLLKSDESQLVRTIGMLALVWARWNLQAEDTFRQNEVLLVMSTLICHTVNHVERARKALPEGSLAAFQPIFEYFLLLLLAVEWPKSWKQPLVARIQGIFPAISPASSPGLAVAANREGAPKDPMSLLQYPLAVGELREAILQHPFTHEQAKVEAMELDMPEPGQEFFERHRGLYGWAMRNDEAIAREFVLIELPRLPREVLLPPDGRC